jgi:hypothetical protein
MNQNSTETPKVFISYSWSSPEYQDWVLQLAKDLAENGAHVVIDKWDLREGEDKYAFMEKMVTDDSICKVIALCNRKYAEKADGREGGVGTETQIISEELYGKVDQKKFVAVIIEKDENGKPYIPTLFKNRIYIDMSTPDLRIENFEMLLRSIFDKPLYRRPDIGKPPTYLFEDGKKSLGTTSRYHQAIDALKQGKESAPGMCQEYFDTFTANLETFRIKREEGKEFDDQVVQSIEEFLPYREEVINLLMTIAKYRYDSEMYGLVHKFFENILPYSFRPSGVTSYMTTDYDNFIFFLNELFIYAIAALIKNERFEGVNELLQQEYFFHSDSTDAPESRMVPFTYFNYYPASLSKRQKRLGLSRLDLMADMLKQRAVRNDVHFNDVMQADLLIYLRYELHLYDSFRWYPHTLLYATDRLSNINFEIFARSQSERYFNQMKIALGINNKEELIKLIGEYSSGQRKAPAWQFEKINLVALTNINAIATKP